MSRELGGLSGRAPPFQVDLLHLSPSTTLPGEWDPGNRPLGLLKAQLSVCDSSHQSNSHDNQRKEKDVKNNQSEKKK